MEHFFFFFLNLGFDFKQHIIIIISVSCFFDVWSSGRFLLLPSAFLESIVKSLVCFFYFDVAFSHITLQ